PALATVALGAAWCMTPPGTTIVSPGEISPAEAKRLYARMSLTIASTSSEDSAPYFLAIEARDSLSFTTWRTPVIGKMTRVSPGCTDFGLLMSLAHKMVLTDTPYISAI